MTRCNDEDVRLNLKSSVYNQTGQNYFQQLSAYNCMNVHLRRVLLAKSVVDTKNRDYIRQKREKCKTSCRSMELEKNISQDIIDKLAYDTKHHPCDILRMSYSDLRKNHSARCHYQDHCHAGCSHANSHIRSTCPIESRKWNSRASSKKSSSPSPNRKSSCSSERHKKCFEESSLFQEKQKHTGRISVTDNKSRQNKAPRSRKCRYENQNICYNYPSSFESSPNVSCSGTPRGEENNHSDFESINKRKGKTDSRRQDEYGVSVQIKKMASNCEEDAKYTQFAYDITKDIMQNALYTDNELRKVFRKHLRKNTGLLNKARMLQEIRRLKVSLNVLDDDDDNDDNEDDDHGNDEFIVVKPPTPPKVLDENKILSKLESYQKLDEYQRRHSNGISGSIKNVVLVDPNPDLLVTERDVLLILMEMNLTPKQAQNICKKLQYLSRDTSLIDTVRKQSKTEEKEVSIVQDVPNSYRSSEKSRNGRISLEVKSSTTNLIDKKNEMVQTETQSDFKNGLMLKKNHRCLCNDRSLIQSCQKHRQVQNFRASVESTDTGDSTRPDNIIYPSANALLSTNDINLNKNTGTTTISEKFKVTKPIEIDNVKSEENLKFPKSTMSQDDTMNIVKTTSEVKESVQLTDQDKSESATQNVDQNELIEDNVEILGDISENLISWKTDTIESIREDSAANDHTETLSNHEIVPEQIEVNDTEVDNYIDENFENDSNLSETNLLEKERDSDSIISDSNKVSASNNLTEDHLKGNKFLVQESTSSIEALTRNMKEESPSSSEDCSNCFKKIKNPWKRTKPITMTPIIENPDSDVTISPAKLPKKSSLKDPLKLQTAAQVLSKNSKNLRDRHSDSDWTEYPKFINLPEQNKESDTKPGVSDQKKLSQTKKDSALALETSETQKSNEDDVPGNVRRYSTSSDVLWASTSAKNLYMKRYTNSTLKSDSSSHEDEIEDEDTEHREKRE
ncbi:uncharacterized protein LOC107274721 isoform X2 [Cephus cinctus]|uniref:Uncharacterized protein LOC107274721 isoform X2 n=1 Tax=Cephus cinctus TaxID=211228 RepID=A0AAJ7FV14_CEPCN|nr:uncharacterized protein LOC107274721 isoform X2 [Cephus cinctus]